MKRICVALAVWFCSAVSALAQDKAQLPLVGLVRIDTPATLGLTSRPLREALATLGYVDGNTIRLDFRLAEGDAGRFPEMAAALVRGKPSVIVAQGEAASDIPRIGCSFWTCSFCPSGFAAPGSAVAS